MENLKDDQFKKFQVTIRFYMDEEFMKLVPSHRVYINDLIDKNIIDYYAVSMETQRSWMIINAVDKKEVEEYLAKSSLHNYWTIEIDELFVYDSQAYRLPALQLN
jgi:hypothetical protein